jgi:hypothetical protein
MPFPRYGTYSRTGSWQIFAVLLRAGASYLTLAAPAFTLHPRCTKLFRWISFWRELRQNGAIILEKAAKNTTLCALFYCLSA